MGSIAVAAWIAKIAFVGLLIGGLVYEEIGVRAAVVFAALGLMVWFGLPLVRGGELFVTSGLAIVDVALVFAIFKGDVRIG